MVLFSSIDFGLYIPFQSFVPTGPTLLFALGISLLVGVISVSYSAFRVSGMTIAEALRSTE